MHDFSLDESDVDSLEYLAEVSAPSLYSFNSHSTSTGRREHRLPHHRPASTHNLRRPRRLQNSPPPPQRPASPPRSRRAIRTVYIQSSPPIPTDPPRPKHPRLHPPSASRPPQCSPPRVRAHLNAPAAPARHISLPHRTARPPPAQHEPRVRRAPSRAETEMAAPEPNCAPGVEAV